MFVNIFTRNRIFLLIADFVNSFFKYLNIWIFECLNFLDRYNNRSKLFCRVNIDRSDESGGFMKRKKIPDEAVQRLPIYLRGLLSLSQQGHKNISSKKLADFLGVNHWQIRKDLSYFGGFGTPGIGYNTEKLRRQIRKILKLSVVHKAVLVGVGYLGSAVLKYPGFGMFGFNIVAAFDNDPKKIGRRVGNIMIEDVSNLQALQQREIEIGIITVPCEAAQETFDKLIAAGIKGILSFSPCYKTGRQKVKVITIDIAMDLARLPYYITTRRITKV